jgi:CPA1 family monovalent cation:H+ antiporter
LSGVRLFESLDAILLAALVLLVVARRLNVPYPTLLAAAGLGFAALPFTPHVEVEPALALALFIAPALLHAAYHSSPRGLKRFWFPLVSLAVFAVIITAGAVTWIGMAVGGLPFAAALALGAIVAPPDAAASEAVTNEAGIPRRGLLILQGESLLNDATALLLFGVALSLLSDGPDVQSPWMLAIAAPAGILFGLAAAWAYLRVIPLFSGSLGASLVDFAVTFGLWLVADRLHLSPVLAIVSFGMMLSQYRPLNQSARDRIQTSAVWAAAILVLNAVAFMLMGLQARDVLSRLDAQERGPAIGFALAVLAAVIVVRLGWVLLVRWVEGRITRKAGPSWLPAPPPWKASLVLGWSGMRGIVTLAAAFALPADVPGRDQIVLAAFSVVIGTLVLQGLTLGPLIRWLNAGEDGAMDEEIGTARKTLIRAGFAALGDRKDASAQALRIRYGSAGEVVAKADDPQATSDFERLHLEVLDRQRIRLHEMRDHGEIADDVYRRLLEELDWSEVDARSFADNELRAS